jgi:hypothetical protein
MKRCESGKVSSGRCRVASGELEVKEETVVRRQWSVGRKRRRRAEGRRFGKTGFQQRADGSQAIC